MSNEVKHREKKKRSSRILNDTKLHDIHRLFREALKRKEHHRQCDLEEIRIIDRFERSHYENARTMKRKADSARAKWKGLRDTFRGELKKLNKTITSGTQCQSTNWEYFDEMLFVKDQIYSNRRSLAYILKSQQKMADPTAESSVEESNASADTPMVCEQDVAEENEDTQGRSEDDSAPVKKKIEPETKVQPTDDDYNFLMSILPQLRNLPTTRNLYVRLKIQELLYNEIASGQDNN